MLCNIPLTASTTTHGVRWTGDSLIYLTHRGAKNVLKEHEDLKAAQARELVMNEYLEGLKKQTGKLTAELISEQIKSQKNENIAKRLKKELFWANMERWSWRVAAVVLGAKLLLK